MSRSDPSLFEKIKYRLNHPQNGLEYQLRYGWINRKELTVEDIHCVFDTSSLIAKKWFFPRYRNEVTHEMPVYRFLYDILSSDDNFLDVGANMGQFSVFSSQICEQGEVHALEMDPELIPIIQSNFKLNDVKNGQITCAAISDRSSKLAQFQPHMKEDNKSTNQMTPSASSPVQIPTLTLDRYLKTQSIVPDVVKIDVEGAEGLVLKGMQQTLSNHKPRILLELHYRQLDSFETTSQELIDFLEDFDYELKKFSTHRDQVDGDPVLTEFDGGRTNSNPMLYCE